MLSSTSLSSLAFSSYFAFADNFGFVTAGDVVIACQVHQPPPRLSRLGLLGRSAEKGSGCKIHYCDRVHAYSYSYGNVKCCSSNMRCPCCPSTDIRQGGGLLQLLPQHPHLCHAPGYFGASKLFSIQQQLHAQSLRDKARCSSSSSAIQHQREVIFLCVYQVYASCKIVS